MKDKLLTAFYIFIAVLLGSFLLINVFWVIYAFAKYGNETVGNIPYWALWYMCRN